MLIKLYFGSEYTRASAGVSSERSYDEYPKTLLVAPKKE